MGQKIHPTGFRLSVADRHVHMARGLADAVAAAFGTRCETLEGCALFHVNGLDAQLVNVRAIVMLGIGDGGFEHLLNDARCFFLCEGQDVQSLVHFFAANQVCYQTAFVDR